MRTILFASLFMMILASCGGKKTDQAEQDQPVQLSTGQLVAIGKLLVDESDCKTCHHPTNRIIGPSHKEVAEKYEFTDANIKLLAERIINGGTGVWGEIPMTPHADISQEDAEKMAMYVLSLDGEEKK
jgi:cytochrome c